MANDADKTEEPTPKRLEEARKRGQVAYSRDLTGAVVTAGVLGVLIATSGHWVTRLVLLLRESTRVALSPSDTPIATRAQLAFTSGGGALLWVLLAPLGAAVTLSILVGAFQTRGLIAVQALAPRLERLAPSLRRIMSRERWAALAKGAVLVLLFGTVALFVLRGFFPALVALAGAPPASIATALGQGLRTLGLSLVGVALAVGGADYLMERLRFARSLRMSRDEVKREHKDSEGDPHHKAERQRVHRELSQQRALEEVRKADLVVVNPEHIAVALRYDRDGQGAPVVIAHGRNLMAARIREIAREAGVPIFRDVTLARSLAEVQEGDEIPEALYEAVAELLRVVYGMTAGTPGWQGGAPATVAPAGTSEPGREAGERRPPSLDGPGGWTRV